MSINRDADPDPEMLARAQGCLIGQLVGDALGSMVEFMSAEKIGALYPAGLRVIGPSTVHHTIAGQVTDDSELALALARSLATRGAFDEEDVARAYADWRESDPFDVGGTIGQATGAMGAARSRGAALAAAGRAAANRSSEANGALMRQSPLAIWGAFLDADSLAAFVRADTTLTHPNQVCQDASAAFITALAATMWEGLDGAAVYEHALAWDDRHGTSPSVTAALQAAASTRPAYEINGGHVLHAIQNAFYQALHAPSFEEGIVDTVMHGGDPDTNGAIAGALLGAIHGVAGVPEQWRTAVLECRPAHGASGVRRPRPETYWPTDAYKLVEALLAAGAALPSGHHDVGPPPSRSAGAPGSGQPAVEANGNADAPGRGATDAWSAVSDPADLRSRFRAALLGGAIGDALGRPAEGSKTPVFAPPWRYTDYLPWHGHQGGPIGTITDDTQLTIEVAECLMSNGWLDPSDLARRLVAWLPAGRGKGRATTTAVLALQGGTPWYLAGEDNAGNGAAMRAAPVGLLHFRDPIRLRAEATLSALPTHRAPTAVASAVAMAAATAWLVRQKSDAWEAGDLIAAIQSAIAGMEPFPLPTRSDPTRGVTLHDRIGEIPGLLDQPPSKVMSILFNGAFVLESLPAALYFFLRAPHDLEAVLLSAVNAAYDADTVAAMAGTLGGALGGESALPQRLLSELEYRDRLIELADGLYGQAERSRQFGSPQPKWGA